MEKIIILDTNIHSGDKNKIFDRDFACRISHTLLPICYLFEEAKKVGVSLITPDVFLENPEAFKNKKVFLISQLTNPRTTLMVALGVVPLVLLCQESPFIASRFYINLKKETRLFKFSMLFPGMKGMSSKKSVFIPMFFPQFNSTEKPQPISFESKKFLTYIAANKKNRGLVKLIIIKLLYGINIKALYSSREKILNLFSKRNDFDLYGRGWNTETSPTITKAYKGEVGYQDKENKLREYRFALCLENSRFPGYITEKIFDCFFANSIPAYLGAPDITNYIPPNTFIDISKFKNITDLEKYLDNMTENTYNEYLSNINKFLNSDEYIKFSHVTFAKKILDLVSNS